jgi:hypothetical protein
MRWHFILGLIFFVFKAWMGSREAACLLGAACSQFTGRWLPVRRSGSALTPPPTSGFRLQRLPNGHLLLLLVGTVRASNRHLGVPGLPPKQEVHLEGAMAGPGPLDGRGTRTRVMLKDQGRSVALRSINYGRRCRSHTFTRTPIRASCQFLVNAASGHRIRPLGGRCGIHRTAAGGGTEAAKEPQAKARPGARALF